MRSFSQHFEAGLIWHYTRNIVVLLGSPFLLSAVGYETGISSHRSTWHWIYLGTVLVLSIYASVKAAPHAKCGAREVQHSWKMDFQIGLLRFESAFGGDRLSRIDWSQMDSLRINMSLVGKITMLSQREELFLCPMFSRYSISTLNRIPLQMAGRNSPFCFALYRSPEIKWLGKQSMRLTPFVSTELCIIVAWQNSDQIYLCGGLVGNSSKALRVYCGHDLRFPNDEDSSIFNASLIWVHLGLYWKETRMLKQTLKWRVSDKFYVCRCTIHKLRKRANGKISILPQ